MSCVDVPDCNTCSKFGLLKVFFRLLKQVLTSIHTHSIDATLLEYLALTLDDHSFTSAAAKYCRPQLGIKQQLRKESPYSSCFCRAISFMLPALPSKHTSAAVLPPWFAELQSQV